MSHVENELVELQAANLWGEIKNIPNVKHLVVDALDVNDGHAFVYIAKRDDETSRKIFTALDVFSERLKPASLEWQVHISYLAGRPLHEDMSPLPEVVFTNDPFQLAEGRYHSAIAYLNLNDYRAAERACRQAVALDYPLAKDLGKAIRELRKLS